MSDDQTLRRCAVVYNPIKVSDDFRDRLTARIEGSGWAEPLWLETSEEDPGRGMTKQAVESGAELVIGAGGDGTVRIVADGLAGTGVTLGLVPAGTGNLLARNLELPLDEEAALDVVFSGQTREIDLVKLTVDGQHSEHFAVMAGLGVDATIMDETNPQLKKAIGPAAYFLAAGRALGRLPIPMTVKVDNRRVHRRRPMICLVGNVGQLPGGLNLIPDARPDDGRLDVWIASPHRLTHWLRMFWRVMTGRRHSDDQVDSWSGRRVEIRLQRRENYELDGDVVGDAKVLVAELVPGALRVRVPA